MEKLNIGGKEMLKKMETIIYIAVILLFFIGCGESEKKPSKKDYEKQFAVTIPAYLQLDAFDIEVSENVGDKVEPVFKARFKSIVKLKTDTYEIAHQKEGATFIRPSAGKGEKKEIYGIATAHLYAGSWKINYNFENNPIPAMGRPRDFFTGEKFIVIGSHEEAAFEAQIQKKHLAEQQEQERQRAELEQKRVAEEKEKEKTRPNTKQIKSDLIGKQIGTWRFDSLSEFKDFTIESQSGHGNTYEYKVAMIYSGPFSQDKKTRCI